MQPTTSRTCAEQRLARAWASVHDRKPANYLRLLLDVLNEIGTERKVYRRLAERALANNNFQQIEQATADVQGEINRRRRALAQVQALFPQLYRAAA
jgi:hypothetical protein